MSSSSSPERQPLQARADSSNHGKSSAFAESAPETSLYLDDDIEFYDKNIATRSPFPSKPAHVLSPRLGSVSGGRSSNALSSSSPLGSNPPSIANRRFSSTSANDSSYPPLSPGSDHDSLVNSPLPQQSTSSIRRSLSHDQDDSCQIDRPTIRLVTENEDPDSLPSSPSQQQKQEAATGAVNAASEHVPSFEPIDTPTIRFVRKSESREFEDSHTSVTATPERRSLSLRSTLVPSFSQRDSSSSYSAHTYNTAATSNLPPSQTHTPISSSPAVEHFSEGADISRTNFLPSSNQQTPSSARSFGSHIILASPPSLPSLHSTSSSQTLRDTSYYPAPLFSPKLSQEKPSTPKRSNSENYSRLKPILKKSTETFTSSGSSEATSLQHSVSFSDLYEASALQANDSGGELQYPVVTPPASGSWAESSITIPKRSQSRMNERTGQRPTHQWSAPLSTVASESDRASQAFVSDVSSEHYGSRRVSRMRSVSSSMGGGYASSGSGNTPSTNRLTRLGQSQTIIRVLNEPDEHGDNIGDLRSPYAQATNTVTEESDSSSGRRYFRASGLFSMTSNSDSQRFSDGLSRTPSRLGTPTIPGLPAWTQ
jgi:hypothetical protein